MARFDVYRNPSVSARHGVPYVVSVQSDLLDGLPTRLTIPLGTETAVPTSAPKSLCPRVELDGQVLYALPQFVAAFRCRDLGQTVGSLADQSSLLVGAIDVVISGV